MNPLHSRECRVRANFRENMDKATEVLKRLEWSASYSYCTGWPACPICKGIKPKHGRDERGILPDNQGHRPGCALADALAVPNVYLGKNINWKPVSEVPKFKVNPRGYSEHRDILVWIDDKNFQGFALGRCVKFEDLDYEFCADGYNGNWRITHWCYVEAPNAPGNKPSTSGD